MSTVLIDMELFAADLLREIGWFSLHHQLGLDCEIICREESFYKTNNAMVTEEAKVAIRRKKEELVLYAEACVRALIDDLVTSRLNWADNTTNAHYEDFKKLFPKFDYDSTDKLIDLFINDVYDPFYCRVDDLLGKAMPRRTWFQWSVTQFSGTLILHKGRDWRVIEWERITGFNNPKTPKKTKPSRKPRKAVGASVPVRRTAFREGKSKEALLEEQKQHKEVLEQQAQEEAAEIVLKGQVKNTMKKLGNVRVEVI